MQHFVRKNSFLFEAEPSAFVVGREEGALQRRDEAPGRIPERNFDVLTAQGAFSGCGFTLKTSCQENQEHQGNGDLFSELLLLHPHPNASLMFILTF